MYGSDAMAILQTDPEGAPALGTVHSKEGAPLTPTALRSRFRYDQSPHVNDVRVGKFLNEFSRIGKYAGENSTHVRRSGPRGRDALVRDLCGVTVNRSRSGKLLLHGSELVVDYLVILLCPFDTTRQGADRQMGSVIWHSI